MRISVCMATYNGEAGIKLQLDSILTQLNDDDEIIIVDDSSFDRTTEIINFYNDERIKCIYNETNQGVIETFSTALMQARGDFIFLCDQDDEWCKNKRSVMLDYFRNNNADLIIHDAEVIDRDGNLIFDSWQKTLGNCKPSIINNIIKNKFTGCCMAFRKEIIPYILPIPKFIDIHDQWIGLMALIFGFKVTFLDDKLIKYIRHGSNTTSLKRRSFSKILFGRSKLILAIIYFTLKNRLIKE